MRKYIISLALIAGMTACSQAEEPQVADGNESTSSIEEERQYINASINPLEFDEAMEQADLIAEVEIVEKVEEVPSEHIPYTVFRASIDEKLAGSTVGEEITIKQQGTSDVNFNGNELFEEGEKYIFFLKETKQSKSDYWIIGEETGMFYVSGEKAIKLVEPTDEFKSITLPEEANVKAKRKGKNDFQVLNKGQMIKMIKTSGGDQ